MGLTAYHMSDVSRLARLADDPQGGTSREEIYLAVASLYRIQGTGLNQRERALMREILVRLTRNVEMAIRIALAERLAGDPTVPHDLVLLLADDAIEVARPVILRSPLLTEADMLRLIAGSGGAHQEAVAARAGIGMAVTAALAELESETVLLALVRNATAQISRESYRLLVEKSRAIVALQEPLAQRPDLPRDLAGAMCEWVSEALRSHIRAHYCIASDAVEAALHDVSESLLGGALPSGDGAGKLIDRLASSGQIKTGFLLHVLNQGRGDLFDLAFARLLDMPPADFCAAFYAPDISLAALACRAVGINRSAFATIFTLSRRAQGMPQSLSLRQQDEAATIFAGYTRTSALIALKGRAI